MFILLTKHNNTRTQTHMQNIYYTCTNVHSSVYSSCFPTRQKYEYITHNNTSSCEDFQTIIDCRLYFIRKQGFEVKNVFMDLFLLQMLTDGLEWCGLLRCFYQTLILTAPIHCRASIDERVMKKQTQSNLESELFV